MKWRIPVLCLFVPLWCLAAEPYVPKVADPVLEPWRWQEVEELAGLGVRCVDEAADGSVWFGCVGGLVRYDGRQVEHVPFGEELVSSIQRNPNRKPWAAGVLCLQDGSLLAVVDSGLAHWKNGEWKVVLRDVGAPSFQTRLKQTADGTIWLLVEDALWMISGDLSKQDVLLPAKDGRRLTSFCFDESGDVWIVIGSLKGYADLIHIPLLDGRPQGEQVWGSYAVKVERAGRESRICAGDDGKIWYVDNNAVNGIRSFDPATKTWDEKERPDSGWGYFSLMKDRNGTLWAGGPGLLYAIRGDEERYYSPAQLGLASIPLMIHETTDGKWWVIGRGGYVYAMDPSEQQWVTYVGLHFECETKDGKQWFIDSGRKVVSHNPSTGEWLRYAVSEGVVDWPRSLYASSHGVLWVVGSHGGRAALTVFDGEHWERHEHPEFAGFIERGVLEAADGTVWFGAMGDRSGKPDHSTGGALQYEVAADGKVRLLKHHPSNVFPYAISRIAQTHDGTLWLAAPTMHRYDPHSGAVEVEPDLPAVYTHDMVVDRSDRLWVAKGLFGLHCRENSTWRVYGVEDGLAGKLVVNLLPLRDGTLLAAADTGISRFDGQRWMGDVFNADFAMSGRSGNMQESADGSIWFNFTNKDTRSPQIAMNIEVGERFRTVRYSADSLAPDTFIGPHLDEVDSAGNIHLSWSGRDVWANTPKDRLQFSWRVNGGAWSPFSYDTSKTLLNLDSGRHSLEVRARDRDFNVDASPARSSFTVALPIWRRAWFVSMVLLIAGGAAVFIWTLIFFHEKRLKERAQHLMELDQMKTGFFTNISHELRTPLTLIARPLERLLEKERDESKREMLDMALRNSNRVWNLASQLLDFRRLEQGKMRVAVTEGDIAQCIREVIETLRPTAEAKQIECRVALPSDCPGCFDADKLKKIVQNLVNNAIKYTPVGGVVEVALAAGGDGHEMRLTVADTGPGIGQEHLKRIFDRFYRIPEKSIVDGSGIGLNLAKELVELLGGTIRAESPVDPGKEHPGTRFTVCLPFRRIAGESGYD